MTDKNILIIGAGLAGSFTALALCERGFKCRMFHTHSDHKSSASMVPLALYNPAAAMRARKGWQAETCASHLEKAVRKLLEYGTPKHAFYADNGVLRPALDEKMKRFFYDSTQNEDWPENWVSWMEADELEKRFPEVEHSFGAIYVSAGKTFDTPALLKQLHVLLEKEYNCIIQDEKVHSLKRSDEQWNVTTNKSTYSSNKVLLAAGSGSFELIDLSNQKHHQVKGQAIEIEKPVTKDNYPSVSSKGYIAMLNNKAVIGSTYEHHFDNLDSTEKGIEILKNKLTRTFTNTGNGAPEVKSSWAGIRITTPDRMPLLGELPGEDGLYLSIGFGSKGLMYSPYCGELLAAHIQDGRDLPFEVSLKRQLPPSD